MKCHLVKPKAEHAGPARSCGFKEVRLLARLGLEAKSHTFPFLS